MGPILRWRGGDTVHIAVRKTASNGDTLHPIWHGIILAGETWMVVPGLKASMASALMAMYEYKFKVNQNGKPTGNHKAILGSKEQARRIRCAGSIDAKEPRAFSYDRDYVRVAEPTDGLKNPNAGKKKKTGQAPKKQSATNKPALKRTVGDFIDALSEDGVVAAVAVARCGPRMKMSPDGLA